MEVNQPPSDEVLSEAVRLYEEHGNNAAAASRAAGVSPSTFKDRLGRAAAVGLLGTKPVLPGFRLTKTTAVTNEAGEVVREFIQQKPELGEAYVAPDGHAVKGYSTLVDGTGRIVQQWIKTREERDASDFAAILKDSFKDFEGYGKRIEPPDHFKQELMTVTPCNDWHIGMFSWGKDTGTDWDLKIAERVIGETVETVVERSKPSGLAIVLGGGDLMHADNKRNETVNGTRQDVDGRYEKVLHVATRLKVRTIDAHLRKHDRVIVRILPGNHDRHAAVAVAYFLLAWYRNEPRVTVDVDPSLFFWHRFGKVMIGSTHGDEAKMSDMPRIMAARRAEDWGQTLYRYVHTFHIHHKTLRGDEASGCISESHQAPIPPDGWHFGRGYLSGRSIQSIHYHRDTGEIGRTREAVLDAANDNVPPALRVAA